MKKMSDVWGEMHLPSSFATIDSFIMNGVEYSSGDYKALIFGNDEPADATIKAIHMHDELVEMLVQSRKELEEWMKATSLYDSNDVCEKIDSLLERCK